MRKLFKNGRYANVTATLALFVALGGTSYAALTLPANSVSTKQIKKGSVTLNRISSGARAALKGQTGSRGATGERGPTGPAGPAGTGTSGSSVLWATVASSGGLVAARSSHSIDANFVSTGINYVTFDRDVSNCAYQASIGGDPSNHIDGNVSIEQRAGHTDQVVVNTFPGNQPFYLTVFC